nr:uncharacterized protein LOC111507520 isoform X1 [Leptinotarsa decemlineata]
MVRSFPKAHESNIKDTEDSDKFCLGNLDSLNLRLEYPPVAFRGSAIQSPNTREFEKGSGDSLQTSRHRHPLERTQTRSLVPNITKLPKGYGNTHPKPSPISSDNLVLLYSKDRNPEYISTEPISRKDFLFPSKKKTHAKIIDVVSEDRMSKYNSRINKVNSGSFPFKFTPSGNLKVETSQVVFSSNKLSVLVADPENTKVSIHPETNHSKMAHEATDVSKTSAMDTIMSQAGFSSLGTLIGNTPIRSGNKEASEYESKQTSEILDPELNLGRLGYNGADDISWQKVLLPEKKNLYLELYSRITNYTNADCKVYIDNEEFNCHLIVLQCYSELFDAYIAVKKVELPSDKCSASAFAFIYEWMITGEPSYKELNRENVLDIFNSAKYLKIKDLVEQCWAFIDHADVFTEDTAFLLYMDAKDKNLPEVRELMLPRIQGFFLMLVSSQNWLELELEDIKNFLKSNYVCVNCEMEIFMSAVRWLKHDWINRDVYKYEILECVRFGNIAPWQLVDIKRNPENPDFMELAKDPRICKMIDDGLAYVIIKYWYGQENDDFQHWNAVLGLQEPPPRNWSGSDKTYFTYREFLIYLDQYRRNQLIEKNKPKIVTNEKPEYREPPRRNHLPVEKSSPRVPTMEEFLSKKKVGELLQRQLQQSESGDTTSTSQDQCCQKTQYFPTYQRKPKKWMTRPEAATVIQKAYRRFRQRQISKLLTSEAYKKMKKNDCDKKSKREKVLGMFSKNRIVQPQIMTVLNENTHTLRTVQSILVKHSLFQKNRETVLVIGGIDPHSDYGAGRNTGKDIFQYVYSDNTWEFVGELPEPRHHHCAAFYKGRVFIVGGGDPRQNESSKKSEAVASVWSFDPVRRIWFKETSLWEARKNFGMSCCSLGLYAIGGQGKQCQALRTVERYRFESRNWENMAPLIKARTGFACIKYRNHIWVAGGLSSGNNESIDILDSVETYDIKANQWTEMNFPLRFPRCFSCMFAMYDKLYIIGGAGKITENNTCTTSIGNIDYWNDKKLEWKTVTELSIPRHGHAVSSLGTQILIVGGVTTIYGRALSNTECFCSQRETWVRGLACLPTPLSGHSVVTLPPASLLSF